MKKAAVIMLCALILALAAGCGKPVEGIKETTNSTNTASSTAAEENGASDPAAETNSASAGTNTEAAETENNIPEDRNWDRIPTVMIDGILYESTGYISSAVGCGNMDGKITSAVDGPELPSKNDQSNFGAGYEYQRSSEGQVIVVMDGFKVIFRDPEHSFDSEIPEEVLNFRAEVLEVRNDGLLVSFIDAPELFMPPLTGQCVVRTNPEILKDKVDAGDTVRVWFDGLVQEIYPPILPNVYRVVREEFEYHQNPDGTWNYGGQDYKHRLMLTGTMPNAAGESFFAVLTDREDITFKDVSDRLFSSTIYPEEDRKFVLANLGVYTPACDVQSAKVLVSAVDADSSGVTVRFDQYDNTIKDELLTGEYFVLEKKAGDGWTEPDPVISNAAFPAVGIVIQKGGITRKKYDWEWLYGKQDPGQYRIRVQVIDSAVHEAAAEFVIR